MKRYMMALMIAAVAAGTAFAQEGNNEQAGQNSKALSQGNGDQPQLGQDQRGARPAGPMDPAMMDQMRAGGHPGGPMSPAMMEQMRGGPHPGGPMDPTMMEQMRADHMAIQELGAAARAETDEAKKAEIVAQLRTKIGEVTDRMQANQEQRLAREQERVAALKANRDSLIEEQVKQILTGANPQRPERFNSFPNAKDGMPGAGMPPPPLPPPAK